MINAGKCIRCKCEVWIPDALEIAAQQGKPNVTFYCGYGHPMVYAVGESEETKLRRERDRLMQRIAEKDDEIGRQMNLRNAAERSTLAMKRVVTRIKNRVGRGVCPCCNRTFENLHRHMTSKHPTFIEDSSNNATVN